MIEHIKRFLVLARNDKKEWLGTKQMPDDESFDSPSGIAVDV